MALATAVSIWGPRAARTAATSFFCLICLEAAAGHAGHGVGDGSFNLGSESSKNSSNQLLLPHLLGSSSSLGSRGLSGNSSKTLGLGLSSSCLLLCQGGHRGGGRLAGEGAGHGLSDRGGEGRDDLLYDSCFVDRRRGRLLLGFHRGQPVLAAALEAAALEVGGGRLASLLSGGSLHCRCDGRSQSAQNRFNHLTLAEAAAAAAKLGSTAAAEGGGTAAAKSAAAAKARAGEAGAGKSAAAAKT